MSKQNEVGQKMYKCVGANLESFYDCTFVYNRRKKTEVVGAEVGEECGGGLHLAFSIPQAVYWASGYRGNWRVFEVDEYGPELGRGEDKIRVGWLKLGKEVQLSDDLICPGERKRMVS